MPRGSRGRARIRAAALLAALPVEAPGLTPRELAARLRAPPATVTMALRRALLAGLVARSSAEVSGRRGRTTHRYWREG